MVQFAWNFFGRQRVKQVWYWDVDHVLYFTLEKHHSAPPNPLAGFKPILCLVVFS